MGTINGNRLQAELKAAFTGKQLEVLQELFNETHVELRALREVLLNDVGEIPSNSPAFGGYSVLIQPVKTLSTP